MANWAELPYELLVLIAMRVKVIEDFIGFGVVCTSWQTAATMDNFDVFSPQVPLLMQTDKLDDDYREFYSLSKNKVSRIFLPEARGRNCFPLEGWLLTADYSSGEMNLLHPFTRTQIQLPSQKSLLALVNIDFIEGRRLECILNVVLSANPSLTSNYALVVYFYGHINGNGLAFWQPGDVNWTEINISYFRDVPYNIKYYKGKLYVVCSSSQIWVFEDLAQPAVLSITSTVGPLFERSLTRFYLVEVSGALLLIVRFAKYMFNSDEDRYGFKTMKLYMYELDVSKGESKRIKTLGESAIFLGCSVSNSIDASKFKLRKIKPNHIYFSNDWFEFNSYLKGMDGRNMGVFNVEDKKYDYYYCGLSLYYRCLPTWVIPSIL